MDSRRGIQHSRLLNPNDLAEARNGIWNQFGGDPAGHGTAQDRLNWFDYGYRSYSLASCNQSFR